LPEILWLVDIVILASLGLLSAFLASLLWPFIQSHWDRDTPRVKPLEDSQPPIDLPADVCGDAAGVGMGAGVNLPAEGGREDAKVILNSADVAGIRLELTDPLDTP
jgi:hypothetical protein